MRPLSQKQKSKMSKTCTFCFAPATEAHHPLIYRNKQIDEIAVPLCVKCHRGNNGDIFKKVKDVCELLVIERYLEYLKQNYPKFNWEQRLKYLCQKAK